MAEDAAFGEIVGGSCDGGIECAHDTLGSVRPPSGLYGFREVTVGTVLSLSRGLTRPEYPGPEGARLFPIVVTETKCFLDAIRLLRGRSEHAFRGGERYQGTVVVDPDEGRVCRKDLCRVTEIAARAILGNARDQKAHSFADRVKPDRRGMHLDGRLGGAFGSNYRNLQERPDPQQGRAGQSQ